MLGLGLFRIFGENPEVSPGAPGQNSGEGCPPLARVLSDGGLVGMVVTPPVFGVALSSITQRIIPVYSIFVNC